MLGTFRVAHTICLTIAFACLFPLFWAVVFQFKNQELFSAILV